MAPLTLATMVATSVERGDSYSYVSTDFEVASCTSATPFAVPSPFSSVGTHKEDLWMPSTHSGYAAARSSTSATMTAVNSAIGLRMRYAMPGTDMAYPATRSRPV
eukprot:3037760-Rhodomonas_salina.3